MRVQQSYWLFGLYGWAIIDEREHCPEGLAKVVNESAPSDVVLSVISLGIWTPRTLYLHCRATAEQPS